jgi:hypothetical protein
VWSDAEEPFLELALSATNLDIVPLIAHNGDKSVVTPYISTENDSVGDATRFHNVYGLQKCPWEPVHRFVHKAVFLLDHFGKKFVCKV